MAGQGWSSAWMRLLAEVRGRRSSPGGCLPGLRPCAGAIRLATWPPLKPASMFTTTTLEAQLLSIPSRAATPWKCAP